jgi:hypothetical protein
MEAKTTGSWFEELGMKFAHYIESKTHILELPVTRYEKLI